MHHSDLESNRIESNQPRPGIAPIGLYIIEDNLKTQSTGGDFRGKTQNAPDLWQFWGYEIAQCSNMDRMGIVLPGMVHMWVAQKNLKRDVLRVFTMSHLLNIEGDYWLMTGNRKRLLKQLNVMLTLPRKYSVILVKCVSSV